MRHSYKPPENYPGISQKSPLDWVGISLAMINVGKCSSPLIPDAGIKTSALDIEQENIAEAVRHCAGKKSRRRFLLSQ